MANEAKIKISGDGKSGVRAFQEVTRAEQEMRRELERSEREYGSWSERGNRGTNAATMAMTGLQEVMKGVYRAAVDFSRAANDFRPINFGTEADKAKALQESLTRMQVRGGQDLRLLDQQVKSAAQSLGVMPDRVVATARALQSMTYDSGAMDGMQALGNEANDTDRSLEEMVPVAEALKNKFGVAFDKMGDSFRKVRDIAQDMSVIGGHMALEDTIVRLSPLLMRFQGGLAGAASLIAAFGKGKNPFVAEQHSAAILGSLAGADPLLVTKKLREITGDPNYNAYTDDPATGETVWKRDALAKLQGYLRTRPFGAVLRLFGNNIGAARGFLRANLNAAARAAKGGAESRAAEMKLPQGMAFPLEPSEQTPSDRRKIRAIDADYGIGKAAPDSELMETAAGQRLQADVERAMPALEVGEATQAQRDKYNALFKGQRGKQAAFETATSYLPAAAQDVVNLGTAAVVEAKQGSQEGSRASTPAPRVIDLSDATTQRLSRQIGLEVRKGSNPQPGAAAKAVEANKTRNRAGPSN